MAFDIKFLARVSSSGNGFGPVFWSYNGSAADGSDEAVATIAASGYFNNAQVSLTVATGQLHIGDVIHIRGNDANGLYAVTAVTTNVTVESYAALGTIDTAQLADGAVTAAKLDSDAVTTVKILDNNVTSAKLAVNLVQYARVSVSLANFIGSYTASVELVAAPGAGLKLILHRASLAVDYGGTVLADGGAVHIQYDDTANGAGTKASGTLAAATLISATADTTFGFSPVDTTLVDSATLNKGLYFAAATADFTGGTSSTYEFDIWYSTVDLS